MTTQPVSITDISAEALHVALALAVDFDRILPPGGVKVTEKGKRHSSGKIVRVGEAFPGRYVRDVITWPMADDANKDNWPVYYGPWREHQS